MALACASASSARRAFASVPTSAPAVAAAADNVRLTQYVNPRIGTGGHGHVFLGANVPFGYVQLGPTEPTRGWDWCSGYHDSDSVLIGFGHQHLSGTGIGDLGDVALLPVASDTQRQVIFSHADEQVRPGYYAVSLKANGRQYVKAELTATQRTGMHRYTFASGQAKALLVLDLKQGIGWDAVTDMQMKQLSPRLIVGHRYSKGWAPRQLDFFAMEFSQDVQLAPVATDTVGLISTLNMGMPLLVKVGLSAVSVENALGNLLSENPGWDFDAVCRQTDEAWNAELSKIRISTADEAKRRVFYTALYHTMTAPSVFSDVCGEYRGADGLVHEADFTNYTTLSLWDTYRAAHPLQTLIHPERQRDIAQTLLHIFSQQGKLPVWHLMGNETDCMIGNPAVPVLADLVLKGFDVDGQEALRAMTTSARLDERSMGLLKQYGYIPFDKEPEHETVAKGLEYALADDAIARVAKALGNQQEYDYFSQRSKSYRNYFDKTSGFMRGLSSERRFRQPFNPFHTVHRADDYCEGNAWQYTWLVPHDVHGLISLFGSERAFIQKFDSLFVVEGDLGEDASPDVSGLIGQYAHGNEPCHHVLYMYAYAGQPWKAAPLLRKVMREQYRDTADGLSGNEDVGQMSSWYVLSSIGLYQVEPAGGKYIIGSPIFDEATLNVGDGKRFTVRTIGGSDMNIYIQRARLNGKPYTKSYIDFRDIARGGTLELVMGPRPSKWGTARKDRP
ncbi:MAG: GH92 family glycosyl hydrolase [Bacteroidaceae bacterium]|nr:GH92 family glycosyl hydrolase [Bacteroidaceae bacterium]